MRHGWLLFACTVAFGLSACSQHHHFAREIANHATESLPLDKAERLTAEIHMDTGELHVQGGSPKLLEADFRFDGVGKPVVRYSPGSGTAGQVTAGQVTLDEPQDFEHQVEFGRGRNEWDLRLHDGMPIEILTHLGAGNAELNLGSLALRNVEIHMGVGNLDLDLRGAPKHDYDVDIKGGVGNATVHLPKDVEIVANAKGGVGNIEAHGLEKHNGQWVSRNPSDAKVAIHLDIRGGVGNIDLIAE